MILPQNGTQVLPPPDGTPQTMTPQGSRQRQLTRQDTVMLPQNGTVMLPQRSNLQHRDNELQLLDPPPGQHRFKSAAEFQAVYPDTVVPEWILENDRRKKKTQRKI
jgi:hypothetical protein